MSFNLTRKQVPLPDGDAQHAVYPLEITCVADDVTLSKIFVYRAAVGQQPGLGDVFSCVASPPQMRQLPEDAPAVDPQGRNIPFFRKDVLRLDCTFATQVEDIWRQVVSQVEDLAEDLAQESLIQTTATTTIS